MSHRKVTHTTVWGVLKKSVVLLDFTKIKMGKSKEIWSELV